MAKRKSKRLTKRIPKSRKYKKQTKRIRKSEKKRIKKRVKRSRRVKRGGSEREGRTFTRCCICFRDWESLTWRQRKLTKKTKCKNPKYTPHWCCETCKTPYREWTTYKSMSIPVDLGYCLACACEEIMISDEYIKVIAQRTLMNEPNLMAAIGEIGLNSMTDEEARAYWEDYHILTEENKVQQKNER